MVTKYLLLSFAFVTFLSIEAKLSDSIDFLSSWELQLNDELFRVRRDSNSSTEDDAWKQRLEKWANMIEKVSVQHFNISIIGWQDIYDSSGKIKAVASIELAFPVREDVRADNILRIAKDNYLHDRSSQHKLMKSFQITDELKRQGTLLDVIIEAKEKHADSPVLLYWTPTTTYFRPDRLVTFNKIQTATKEEVQKFIEETRSKKDSSGFEVVVLVYDEDGNLKGGKVEIPDFSVLSYVVDSWQASDKILLESPRIMAEIPLKFKIEEIPKQLGLRFNEAFPNYDWRVLVNPKKFVIDSDVWVKLSTDGFEFYDGKKKIYVVYGIKI